MRYNTNLTQTKLENIGLTNEVISNEISTRGVKGFFNLLYFEKGIKGLSSLREIRDYLYEAEILKIKNKGRYFLETPKFNIEKYFEELKDIEKERQKRSFGIVKNGDIVTNHGGQMSIG